MAFPGMCVLASGVDRLMDSRWRTIPLLMITQVLKSPVFPSARTCTSHLAVDFRDSFHRLSGELLPPRAETANQAAAWQPRSRGSARDVAGHLADPQAPTKG
jgi:hypothetical protein